MSGHTFTYSIDRDDRVASVSEAWLDFARRNRAPELTRDAVLGRPLWDFIAGRETRTLYEDLFEKVRTRGASLELPFRCDSPDRFRFMRLVLSHAPEESIDCCGILVREQERPFFSILDQAFPRTGDTLSMCSLCKRIQAFDVRWLELEDAIRELDLFDSANLPALRYAVCGDCAALGRSIEGGAAA